MVGKEKIEYWLDIVQNDLDCFLDIEHTRELLYLLAPKMDYVEFDNKGVILYLIDKDFVGNKVLNEVFMYIRKEYRGNIRLFIDIIREFERQAKNNACQSLVIGSNIGYKDDKVLSFLIRMGYKTDCVRKEL